MVSLYSTSNIFRLYTTIYQYSDIYIYISLFWYIVVYSRNILHYTILLLHNGMAAVTKKWKIAKELKITPILDKLIECKTSWIQHVNRMPRNRLPRVMKYYSPTGRRNHGRHLKRLLDTWDRNGSTSGHNSMTDDAKIWDLTSNVLFHMRTG